MLHDKIKGHLGDKYQPSDDELINLYCETHAFYCRLREEIANSDLMMQYTNKGKATNYIKNPLTIELTKTVQTLNNLLKSLGLTAAQRKKAGGGGEDDSDFEDF